MTRRGANIPVNMAALGTSNVRSVNRISEIESNDSTRFFSTNLPLGINKSTTTAGSFIRPARKPDPAHSFSEALKAKYASDPVQDPSIHIVFATKPGDNAVKKDPLARINQPIRISGKEVEEVGFDKIRKQLAQLSELKIVILDGLCMERSVARLREGMEEWAKGLTDVREACPKAIELDLSRNLFEEWREVASICEQLEKLKSLRVEYVRPFFHVLFLNVQTDPSQRKPLQRHFHYRSRTPPLPPSLYAHHGPQN